jgi:hypothetical protein
MKGEPTPTLDPLIEWRKYNPEYQEALRHFREVAELKEAEREET